MIDERDIERRVKLIKKRNLFGIIMRIILLVGSLCMLLPVIKVQVEVFDGVRLNLGSFDLIRTDIDSFRDFFNRAAEQQYSSDRSAIWNVAREKYSNDGGYVLFFKSDALIRTLPEYHLATFICGMMCIIGIISKIIKLACADGRVRKWATKINKKYPNGGFTDKKEHSHASICIGLILAAAFFGAVLYVPLIQYPLLFKTVGCEINWFYLLLPVFCLVGFWVVLLLSYLVFTREELGILRTHVRF